MILVPVKNLNGAKQRLATMLTQQQRTLLARAMVKDVCHALSEVPSHPAVALVTSDEYAIRLARQCGFETIRDDENLGESEAIAMATLQAEKRGADFSLVIPGDIPLVTADEISAVLAAAPPEGTVLVPAADGRGTNAILRRPCALIPCRFGNESFLPHRAAARATQKVLVVLDGLPGIALDIDRPEDLAELAEGKPRTRTQRLLLEWQVVKRAAAGD
ncbi:MAG TPA: 2-phospho-L-lactate guanylyltransferase [Terriglobales bacterium]